MRPLALFKEPTTLHRNTRKDMRSISELSKALAITDQRYRTSNLKICQITHFKNKCMYSEMWSVMSTQNRLPYPSPHCLTAKHPTTEAVVERPRPSSCRHSLSVSYMVLIWHTECEHCGAIEVSTELSRKHEEYTVKLGERGRSGNGSHGKYMTVTESTHQKKVQAERGCDDHNQ